MFLLVKSAYRHSTGKTVKGILFSFKALRRILIWLELSADKIIKGLSEYCILGLL